MIKNSARTIYENIDFSVVDLGDDGVEVSYLGRRHGTEVSKTERLSGSEADRIKEMIRVTERTRVPWILAERFRVQRVWRPVCLDSLRWARESPSGIINVSRDTAEDGSFRYWLETRCCEGYLNGEYAEAKPFGIREVREESSRLAALPPVPPVPASSPRILEDA